MNNFGRTHAPDLKTFWVLGHGDVIEVEVFVMNAGFRVEMVRNVYGNHVRSHTSIVADKRFSTRGAASYAVKQANYLRDDTAEYPEVDGELSSEITEDLS